MKLDAVSVWIGGENAAISEGCDRRGGWRRHRDLLLLPDRRLNFRSAGRIRCEIEDGQSRIGVVTIHVGNRTV